MKRHILAAMILVPLATYAASTTIRVTPANCLQHDLAVVVKAVPQTIKEGDRPVRVTGYEYQITISSKKLDMKYLQAHLFLEEQQDSYLSAPLKQWSFDVQTNTQQYRITFSPDHIDHTYILLTVARSGANDYKLKIKDWITTSEPGH